MTINLNAVGARCKAIADDLRNLPLFVLCVVVSLSVEVYAWGAILNENVGTVAILGHQIRLAYPEVAMSTAFSLVALVLGAASASMKSDPRSSQRRRAWAAQFLAVAVLTVPTFYAANAVALQAQLASWREYSGSETEAADRELANSPAVDSLVRAQASSNLRRGIQPERADFEIGSFLWIALILGANMAAIRFGWRERRETPEEARHRLAVMRADKAKITRERNKRARQKDSKAPASNVSIFRRA